MSSSRKSLCASVFDPSLVIAAIGTAAFYGVVFLPAMHDTLLYRYTTEHAVEFVIVALFIWGLVDITLKLLAFPRELIATRQDWLPLRSGREPVANARTMLDQVRAKPQWLLNSRIGQRLVEALTYLTDKGSAEDYGEHLKYLSEQGEDESHASYTLIRFVIAVTPILGFLGTVVHFGTAIGGFSFTDMDEKLPAIVAEMGTAFNTTTVALAAAMTMMFAMFLCERVERGLVATINRLVERELFNRFEIKDPNVVPFLAAVQSANQESLQIVAATLKSQVELWSQSLDALFQKFEERQRQEIHRWEETLGALQERHEDYDAQREERLRQIIGIVDARQDKHMAQLQSALDRAADFRHELSDFLKALNAISRGEGKLVELQASLAENLRVLHQTHQIDGALHGLTAAIHLLTARNRQLGVHDAA